jgi:hypothetical protein
MRDGPSRLVGTTMLLCQLAARSRGRGHYVQGTRRSSGEQSGMAAVSASHRPTRQRAAAHASIRARVPAQEFNPCSAAAEASAHARVWPRHGTVPVPSRRAVAVNAAALGAGGQASRSISRITRLVRPLTPASHPCRTVAAVCSSSLTVTRAAQRTAHAFGSIVA